MKTLFLALITAFISFSAIASPSMPANQPGSFKFVFNQNNKKESFTISQAAATKEDAFKLAAKNCFQKLTNGKYPGEERGLDIIDICANPKM